MDAISVKECSQSPLRSTNLSLLWMPDRAPHDNLSGVPYWFKVFEACQNLIRLQKKAISSINLKILVLSLFFFSMLPFALGNVAPNILDIKPNDAVSNTELERGIRSAADYLKRNCDSMGKFVYDVNIRTQREASNYDIVRHAGAICALALFNQFQSDSNSVEAMMRAGYYMRSNYMAKGPKPDDKMLAIWMEPTTVVEPFSTDLGANGLGLLALTEITQVQPGWMSKADLESVGEFIVFLQRNDGSFYERYRNRKGPVLNWNVLYYPGEAACGLISLYETDHSERWLSAAGKALSYLAKTRRGSTNVPADHWALMATAKLWPYYDRFKCPASREELIVHAEQVCNSMLANQITNVSDDKLYGAFDEMGRTTPSATRLEGLLAALEFMPTNRMELRIRIDQAVQRGINFLLRAQIRSGQYEGGFPDSIEKTNAVIGTLILPLSGNIRIDYVQHGLDAMIKYHDLLPARQH